LFSWDILCHCDLFVLFEEMEVVLVVWKVAIISCVALDKVQLIDEQKYMEEEGSSALYSLLDKHATFKKKSYPSIILPYY
tara:strand:+ start:190 stop:429 length:240 start_codon:yes stop_codon:yes gene_type:complete